MYLYQLKRKYQAENTQDASFDYANFKKKLCWSFWGFFLIYSCFWGTFYYISKEKGNLAWVDLFASTYFIALIPAYLIVGTGLIKEINKRCETDEVRRRENSPAVSPIVKILLL